MNFIKQLSILLLTASVIAGIGAGFYWLFHEGKSYLDASYSASPFTSPILWFAIIIAAIAALFSRFWKAYQERRFIKRLKQQRAAQKNKYKSG